MPSWAERLQAAIERVPDPVLRGSLTTTLLTGLGERRGDAGQTKDLAQGRSQRARFTD